MASNHVCSEPVPTIMTSEQHGSGLMPNTTSSTPKLNHIQKEVLDELFENFYDESCGGNKMKVSTLSTATLIIEVSNQEDIPSRISGSSTTTYEAVDPIPDTPPTTQIQHETSLNNVTPTSQTNVDDQIITNASFEEDTFINPFATPIHEVGELSETQHIDPSDMKQPYQPYPNRGSWTRGHPLHQIIGNHSQPIQTRSYSAYYFFYNSFLSRIEPANVKAALEDPD